MSLRSTVYACLLLASLPLATLRAAPGDTPPATTDTAMKIATAGMATPPAHDAVSAARQFLADQLPPLPDGKRDIHITPPDVRLQLAPCDQAPEAFWANANSTSGSHVVVGVKCASPVWQVFLPAQISEWQNVWVASRPLARGHRLSTGDLVRRPVERMRLRGDLLSDVAAATGSALRQAVGAGEPLSRRQICAVCRGETVDIRADGGGFQVNMQGIAETDGSLGERIRVRNSSSRRVVSGEITAPGQITIR